MTYGELSYRAKKLYTKGKITISEYLEMTKPLNREIEQEPKTGHWIRRNAFLVPWKCSECNYESERYDNYCPYCGAKMESEEKNDTDR